MLRPLTPDPLRLHVVWHPAATEGEALASRLFSWLGQPGDNNKQPLLLEPSLGIPVVFGPRDRDGHPMPLRLSRAECNAVAILLEENLVASDRWRRWIEELPDDVALFPIVLGKGSGQAPERLAGLNAITCHGLYAPEDREGQLDLIRDRLTEALARQMQLPLNGANADRLQAQDPMAPPPPMSVFISHAKIDGQVPASAVRDAVYRETQMRAFYDEADLAYGSPWMGILESQAGRQCAAFVSIFSDIYAHRPWCQHEATLACRPRQHATLGTDVWTLPPTVLVDSLRRLPTRLFDDFGGLRIVRWNVGQGQSILASLVREILLTSVAARRAEVLQDRLGRPDDLIAVSWFPARTSLTALMAEAQDAGRAFERVAHPGKRLSPADRHRLTVGLRHDLELVPFRELNYA